MRRAVAATVLAVLASLALAGVATGQSYAPLQVLDAGSGDLNGTYAYAGMVNGRPSYVKGMYSVEWLTSGPYWKLGEQGQVIDFYCNPSNTLTPPSAGWTGGCGAVSQGTPPYPTTSGGEELLPEIDVRGSGVSIPDGDVTPSTGDLTDFGTIGVTSGTVTHSFSIHNTGTGDLSITTPLDVTGAMDFTVTVEPAATVTAGNSTTFTVRFDAAADGLRAATIAITNSDADENPYTFAVQGTGDGTGPTVSNVAPNLTTIADANVGAGTFVVTADFSEAMNTGVNPAFSFAPALTSTLTFSSGAWPDADTYRATYSVSDANVDVDSVSIDVTGGQDIYGNAQLDYTPMGEFEIDTLNPTVSDIVAGMSPVRDGDLTQEITVTFSEVMATSAAPTIVFSSGTWTPGAAGVWSSGNSVWTRTFTLTDTNVTVANVTVDVTGAQDAAGNAQQDYAPQAEFDIDTQNPTVSGVVAGTSPVRDGDLTQEITVTFSEAMATGAAPTITFSTGTWTPGAAGVWSVGNTVWTRTYTLTDANVAVANVTVDVTGAQDAAGNAQQDYTPQAEFDIDTQNPTVTIAANDLAIYDGDVGVDRFTVTATYSEAMNPAIVPTLTFTPSVVTTFTNPSGAWSGGNTVYTWTYDVADAGVTVADVDLTVSGGQDVAGNVQVSNTNADYVDIDTQDPTVTIAANDLAIYDGDVGADRFTVTATFSEAMNPAIVPTLTFTPSVATTFTNPSGAWSSGNTVYSWTYDVADAGVTVADVDLTVSGGQDVAGNVQVSNTNADYVDVDTQNPTVTSVVASDLLLSDVDAGGSLVVTVDFSEPTSPTAVPTFTFSPSVATTLPAFVGGNWVGAATYQATYSVADANVDVNSVTIDVINAKDAAGNDQQNYVAAHEFEIDTLNPQVTSVVASDVLIADSDAGLTRYVTADFSEPMDAAAVPVFSFSPGITSTLTLTGGTWQTTARYRASYVAADANVDVDSVTVDVTATRDVAGNAQQDYAPLDEFAIDTLNPTVVSIFLSDSLITDADVGGTFTATINYSEPMLSGAPTIVFVPGLGTSLSLLGSSAWSDADTYVARYTILDGGVTVDDDDVQTSLARDLAGNVQIALSLDDNLDVDTENPIISGFSVTGGQVGTKGANPCVREVPFSATVTDPNGCMDPSDIVITSATVPGGNAGITAPYSIVRTAVSPTISTISGVVDVYDLTGCPALPRIVLDATDCVGNSAAQAQEEDSVYDAIVPTIQDFTFNADGTYATSADEYVVNGCCVTTVYFSANVTDNCCIGAGNITVVVTLPTGNAVLENVSVLRAQDGQKRVDITGHADVRCLTSCPARVQVHIEAADCCGNAATPITSLPTTGLVYDETPPTAFDDPNGYEAARCDDLEVRRDDFGQFRLMIRESTPSYIDVVCNDTDNCSACTCCGTLWIYDIVDQPEFGTATIVDNVGDCRGGTSIRYAPNRGYLGSDRFTYRIIDACGNVSEKATVYLQTIREVDLADVFAVACSGETTAIAVTATDLWIDPDDPSRVPFRFDLASGPEHGILALDPSGVRYEPPSTVVSGGALVPTLTFMESASVTLFYTAARDYVGRDAARVGFEDPFGGRVVGNVDIEVQDCGRNGTAAALTVQQGRSLVLVPPGSFASVAKDLPGAVLVMSLDDGFLRPDAVALAWSEEMLRYFLVVDTELLPVGRYRVQLPLGNGETVGLLVEVGESE